MLYSLVHSPFEIPVFKQKSFPSMQIQNKMLDLPSYVLFLVIADFIMKFWRRSIE